MALDNRRTYLCYDNSDLIRDGVIRTKIEKEYLPVNTFSVRRLRNPPKGVNYVVTRDPETKEMRIRALMTEERMIAKEQLKHEFQDIGEYVAEERQKKAQLQR